MTTERKTGNEPGGIPDAEKNGALRPYEAFVTAIETCMNRGYEAVVERLDQLAAFKAGLSTPRVWDKTATSRLIYDSATETLRRVDMDDDRSMSQLITIDSVFQKFTAPDVEPDKKNIGYSASTELGSWLTEGRIKADQRRRISQEQAVEFAKRHGGKPEDYVGLVRHKSQDDLIFEEIKNREAGIMAREALHRAYGRYVATAGDESAGADMALSFSDKPLQIIDIQEIAHDGTGHHHDALMHFIAAGKSMDQLIKDGHEDLAIVGIHKHKNLGKDGKWDGTWNYKHNNPYANDEGWTVESFKNLIMPILNKTDGDLSAVYESWLMFLSFGCASRYGVDKKDDGKMVTAGANISAAMLKETMLFTYIIRGEAGYSWDGKKKLERAAHKGKTGPLPVVLKYPDFTEAPYSLGTFLESVKVKVKKNGKTEKISLMDAIWNKKGADLNNGKNYRLDEVLLFPLAEELQGDQGDKGGADDVMATGAYSAWLLGHRNAHILLDLAVAGPKSGVKELTQYNFWDKLARNANKGFGKAWEILPTDPREREEKIAEASKNGWDGAKPTILMETDPLTGMKYEVIQKLKNEKDVRYILIQGLLCKYRPGNVLEGGSFDNAVDPSDRFSVYPYRKIYGDAKNNEFPGVPIEAFLTSVIDSGFLHPTQVKEVVAEVFGIQSVEYRITFGDSKRLNRIYSTAAK